MFILDLLFAIILVALIALSLLSAYPKFERFPFELFFSALGAASVVILAWDRIADKRGQRLQSLMEHVYLEGGDIKLFQALMSISQAVTNSDRIPDQHRDKVLMAINALRKSGNYHGIDYLYPRKAFKELQALPSAVLQYNAIAKLNEERAKEIASETGIAENSVSAELKGYITYVRVEDLTYVPYLSDGVTPARGYGPLTREQGETMKNLLAVYEATDKESLGIRSPLWRGAIVLRVRIITDEFRDFLEKNGIPAPSAKQEQPSTIF